jgi:zinc protease
MVYRALAYDKHPYSRPTLGFRKTVEALTRADCLAFHRRVFVPNNTMVALVGDFDSRQIIDEVTRLTADWKKAADPEATAPPVDKPREFTQRILSMAEAAQLHFYLGHAGIRRDNPDYYKLLVMDYVLGTGPGFTDRLSARLRDREGLAYTVMANICSSAGEEPGLFTCYIGTAPDNFDRVKNVFLEELGRIREERPTAAEVEDAKQYLLGSLPFQLTTNARIAGQLLYVDRYGLGFGYLDDYRRAVAAVTAEDVQAVARKYLDPRRMVLVAAGPVDQAGKPLGKR